MPTDQPKCKRPSPGSACCFLWKFGVCDPPRPPCRFRHDIPDDGETPCCFGPTCRFGHAKRVTRHQTPTEKLEYWRVYRSNENETGNSVNVVGESPALRDATLLRSQLEPWSTSILRTRLSVASGKDRKYLDTLQRGEIMEQLLDHYKDHPRRIIRVVGAPVDEQIYQHLLQELQVWSQQHQTNTRPSIKAECYMILRSPREFKQKQSSLARKAARKLQRYERLWALATEALQAVDADFANQFSALAVTKGFKGSPHIDKQNTGPFYGLSLGSFADGTGGVCVEVDTYTVAQVNTKGRLGKVDGRYPHWVDEYEGTRFSLIYYSTWQRYQPPGPPYFGDVAEAKQTSEGVETPGATGGLIATVE